MGVKIVSLKERNPHVDFLGFDKYLFPYGKLDVDFGPSIEVKAPYPGKMHDFMWEAYIQRKVIQMGSTLTRIRPQQFCKDGNLGSKDEYADLFVELASCATLCQIKLQIEIRSTLFIMSKKRMISSMLVSPVLMKINGWKGKIGHPKEQGKDMKLNSREGFEVELEVEFFYKKWSLM